MQQPLSESQFEALMELLGAFEDAQHLAVAVSGGPDSMALAFCLQRWAKAKSKSIVAFIVDHALRPESKAEAELTQRRLAMLDIKSEILTWHHNSIVSRLHVTARKARYDLLSQACLKKEILHLFLAHQREDQAETILMRLAKGSGIDGLAGMASSRRVESLWLHRPLLPITKEQLVATCKEVGLEFITDPSNTSEKFARGRLRKVIPLLAEEGLTIDRLYETGERASDAKQALDYYTLRFLHEATSRDYAGALSYDRERLASLPYAIAERALIVGLKNLHPLSYSPEHASLSALLQDLRSVEDSPTRTLHGCLISKAPSKIILSREISAITDSTIIGSGETFIWDGRWRIVSAKASYAEDYFIKPLGNPPHDVVDNLYPGLRNLVPQGRIRASLPAIWSQSALFQIPSLLPVDKLDRAHATLIQSWPPQVI